MRACGFVDNPARPDSVLTASRFPIDRLMDNRKRLPTACQQVARCPQAPQAATIIFYIFVSKKKSKGKGSSQQGVSILRKLVTSAPDVSSFRRQNAIIWRQEGATRAVGLSPRCRLARGVAQPRGIEARRGRDLEQGSMRSTKARTRLAGASKGIRT